MPAATMSSSKTQPVTHRRYAVPLKNMAMIPPDRFWREAGIIGAPFERLQIGENKKKRT